MFLQQFVRYPLKDLRVVAACDLLQMLLEMDLGIDWQGYEKYHATWEALKRNYYPVGFVVSMDELYGLLADKRRASVRLQATSTKTVIQLHGRWPFGPPQANLTG